MYLTEQEQQQINRLVAEVEAASGAQFVVAVIGKADVYPEIPWKAFALGAAMASLFFAPAGQLLAKSAPASTTVFAVTIILACGMALAAATIFVPAIARAFLDGLRATVEVEQYARALFLERGVGHTRRRVGVLILISLFERRAAIVADIGVREHVSAAQADGVIAQMIPRIAGGRVASAAETGLQLLAHLLQGKLGKAAGDNALADAVVEARAP
jgi:putative membrane protein